MILDKTNPAIRIKNLLSAANKITSDIKYHEVWCQVFELGKDDIEGLTKCFGMYWTECKALRNALKDQGKDVDDDIYYIIHTQIDEVVDYSALYQPWRSHKQKLIPPEMIAALSMCGTFLEDDNKHLNQKEYDEIVKTIQKLQKQIDEGSLSDTLKVYLMGLIEKFHHSVISYTINGSIVYKDFLKEFVGDMYVNMGTINGASPEIRKSLMELLKKMSEINGYHDLALKVASVFGLPNLKS